MKRIQGENSHPLVNVSMLQLNKPCTYGSNVALLIRKCNSTSACANIENHLGLIIDSACKHC